MAYPSYPPPARPEEAAEGIRPGMLLVASVISLFMGCCGCVASFIPFAIYLSIAAQIALLVVTIRKLQQYNLQEQRNQTRVADKWMAGVAIGIDAAAILLSIAMCVLVIAGIAIGGSAS
ncbi:MAG TPA: hypothetical protein VLA88_06315 [Candidatus Saccharimonadales bacterium]|nr:hypothetical protein [Candidatus Saccharimonadales bacterium]